MVLKNHEHDLLVVVAVVLVEDVKDVMIVCTAASGGRGMDKGWCQSPVLTLAVCIEMSLPMEAVPLWC